MLAALMEELAHPEQMVRVQVDIPMTLARALDQAKALYGQPKRETISEALGLYFSILNLRK